MSDLYLDDEYDDDEPYLDDEYDDDEPYLDDDDIRDMENERYAECTCGAYKWSTQRGEYVHVADCVCGRV